MFTQILITAGLAYLIGRTIAAHYERENEALKARIVVLEETQLQEREEYLARVNMLNDALRQYER